MGRDRLNTRKSRKAGSPSAGECCRCSLPAVLLTKGTGYCALHRRIRVMRRGAKSTRQACPTFAQLETMFAALVDMRCPRCSRVMTMDRMCASLVTLQHNRDGTLMLLCHSCNARHAAQADDTFLGIPPDHKLCRDCGQVKPLDAFSFNRNHQRFGDRHTYCKACFSERNRRYRLTGTTKKGAA